MKRVGILKYGASAGFMTLVVIAALAAGAYAYFSSSGTGTASAAAGQLSTSSITSSSTGAGTATISWSTVAAPSSGTVKYYVTRNGGTPAGNCPTAAAPSTVTTCTDSGLSKAQYNYSVVAVWQSWTSTSQSVSVTPQSGAASQIVFTTQPGGGATGGLAFPTQPVVSAEDASGITVPSYTGTVSLSIASGTSGANLTGCSGALSGGNTTFTGCRIDKTGTYTLKASDGTFSTTSAQFTVTVGAAAQLVFTTQPGGGATGGSAFPNQPVLTAQDAGGNTVTAYAKTITLTIASGTTGAGLTGCTGTPSGGMTSFTGCTIDKTGTYTLAASDGTLSANSASFPVSVGSASKLAFTTQPGGSPAAGSAFPTQPALTVLDAGGNVVTADHSTATLSITSGTPTQGGPGTLSGCAQTETNGVITFTGCAINVAGNNYKLHAVDGTLPATDSAAFSVSTTPPAVSITYPVSNTTYGTNWTGSITGTATANGGTSIASSAVAINDTTAGKWWNGTSFGAASQTFVSATGTTSWSLGLATSNLTPGHSYTVTAQATDSVGNTGTSSVVNFTYSAASITVIGQGKNTALSSTLAINNVKSTAGANELIVIYCWGGSSCGSTGSTPTISTGTGTPFSSVSANTIQSIVFNGNTKSCVEVVQAVGNGTTGTVTVSFTGGQADNIGFVNVVELSPGAGVKATGTNPATQTQSTSASTTLPTTAGLSELAIVGLDGNQGNDTITPPSGMTAVTPLSGFTNPESSSSIGVAGGTLGMYFSPTAQASANFSLGPAAVDWGTIALGIG